MPVTIIVVVAGADWISAALIVVTVPLIPVFMGLVGLTTRDRTAADAVPAAPGRALPRRGGGPAHPRSSAAPRPRPGPLHTSLTATARPHWPPSS